MSTLHTVNKSPFERNSLRSCLSVAKDQSSVLLIEDGVVAALKDSVLSVELEQAINRGINLYVLEEDLQARGLPLERIMSKIQPVKYSGFVELVTSTDRVQNWL
ncbi:MAG: tRNA 2-thiouridine synthesizing protein B [Gammaproteobacteria bacterium]|jgi:tRNA 2-thiouridine synthesizing protein B